MLDTDIRTHYEHEIKTAREIYPNNLPPIFSLIEKESNPIDFKEELLAITQLYLDGIVSSSGKTIEESVCKNTSDLNHVEETWYMQRDVLNSLVSAGKKAIGSFYEGNSIDIDVIKEIFMPYKAEILKDSEHERSKERRLQGVIAPIHTLGSRLQQRLGTDIETPDTIICISSGGFELSYLAMNITGTDRLITVRYSRYAKGDTKVRIPKNAPCQYLDTEIKNKRIMVVDDWISSGNSLSHVMQYILKSQPLELYAVTATSNGYLSNPNIKIREGHPLIYEYIPMNQPEQQILIRTSDE
ncbi:MAG: phosphoribosyltransferase [archaeon]